MRRAELAEAVLSLVTSPERAVSIVGDLLEDDGGGSFARFWGFVARTAVSQLWQQMWAEPFGVWKAALRGMCVEFGFLLAAFLLLAISLLIAVSVAKVGFHAELPDWAFVVPTFLAAKIAVPFQLGRWVSRRYSVRAGAACLTLAILHALIQVGAGLLFWELVRNGGTVNVDISFSHLRLIDWNSDFSGMLMKAAYYATLYQMLLLAGAGYARVRSLRA